MKRTPGVGVTSTPFEFVTGLNGFKWRGMVTEGSPMSIPPNALRSLINGRLVGGDVLERPGLTVVTDSPLQSASACVRFFAEFHTATPKKLWIVTDGCPDISASVGFSVTNFDPEQDPEFQRVVYYSSLSTSLVVAPYNGVIHIGSDSDLRRLDLIVQDYGTENLAISGSEQDLTLATIPAGNITTMLEFDGKLFIGVDNGAGASFIYVWDGVSLIEDINSIDPPTCMTVHHVPNGGDALFVGFGSSTNHIRYRSTGDPPGSYTTVSPGAGTLDAVEMLSYKDVLYIADASGDVWDYDGSTLAVANSPTSASAVRCLATAFGFLFYGWHTSTTAYIGRFDGSTWADTHKDMTAQQGTIDEVRALREYRGYLFAGLFLSTSVGQLAASPGETTSGTYTIFNMGSSSNPDIDQLVVN